MSDLAALAEAWLDDLCERYPLGYRPVLAWRPLRVSAGIAYYKLGRISLSTLLLTDEERLRITLVHEYAHLLAYRRDPRRGTNHGPVWKQAMRDLGAEPVVRHTYEVERNQRRQVAVYRCLRCGVEILRARRLPRQRRYLHASCGGDIAFVHVRSG